MLVPVSCGVHCANSLYSTYLFCSRLCRAGSGRELLYRNAKAGVHARDLILPSQPGQRERASPLNLFADAPPHSTDTTPSQPPRHPPRHTQHSTTTTHPHRCVPVVDRLRQHNLPSSVCRCCCVLTVLLLSVAAFQLSAFPSSKAFDSAARAVRLHFHNRAFVAASVVGKSIHRTKGYSIPSRTRFTRLPDPGSSRTDEPLSRPMVLAVVPFPLALFFSLERH